MPPFKRYLAIGLMSGTSLDGLDIACCQFEFKNKKWSFEINCSNTVRYTLPWRKELSRAHLLSGRDLVALDYRYGAFIGRACRKFVKNNRIKNIDVIASHGHTVFHRPASAITYQLGSGQAIYAHAAVPVVSDFRSLDVLCGGQGAPLVPIGDKLLFADYPLCLNLGGIANLSVKKGHTLSAHDVSYANMGLNYLARRLRKTCDRGGVIARRGNLDKELLSRLLCAGESGADYPSLSREGFERHICPVLDNTPLSVADKMRTFCEYIAIKVSRYIHAVSEPNTALLATGGGVFNSFLMRRLTVVAGERVRIVTPRCEVVAFKEALIFAFLGVLRMRGEINVLRQVTGGRRNLCAGSLIGGPTFIA